MDKIKVCVAGATGGVGSELVKAIHQSDDLKLVGAVSRTAAGKNISEVLHVSNLNVIIHKSIEDALRVPTNVVIDYTSAEVVKQNVTTAVKKHVNVVIGTSGLTNKAYEEIHQLALDNDVGVFAAGNFAITAVLMQKFAVIAAKYIPSWEIIDFGSEKKVDAPSGTAHETAYKLSQIGSSKKYVNIDGTVGDEKSRGADLDGTQVHSVRLPGYISSLEVLFGLPGERLSIRHDSANSTLPYITGTLLAVRRIQSIKGLVRGMENLLEL
jgi:4-hydroxy-tetrahydrodipicolinate reductase